MKNVYGHSIREHTIGHVLATIVKLKPTFDKVLQLTDRELTSELPPHPGPMLASYELAVITVIV